MLIETHDFVAGARDAQGVAVVIDVFRAFSVACYAFANGAKIIYPVGDVEDAWVLKQEIPDALMVGERHGIKLEGFDLGNSPSEVMQLDLQGKSLIHTTHAGTQGLVNTSAERVFTGALVNARATAAVIQREQPQQVGLVRMGLNATSRTEEDDLCALYLESLLEGSTVDMQGHIAKLIASPAAQRFHDPEKPWSPIEDLSLCTALDRFDFAIECKKDERQRLYLGIFR